MSLQEQVISLELAKQLKELGVKQESLFYWCEQDRMFADPLWVIKNKVNSEVGNRQILSAFTVAELGELLPKELPHQEKALWLETGYDPELAHWWIGYLEIPVRGTRVYPMWEQDTSEADVRAKMLAYITLNGKALKENTK